MYDTDLTCGGLTWYPKSYPKHPWGYDWNADKLLYQQMYPMYPKHSLPFKGVTMNKAHRVPPKFLARVVTIVYDSGYETSEVHPSNRGAQRNAAGVVAGGNHGHAKLDDVTTEAKEMIQRDGEELVAVYKLVRLVRRAEPPIKIEDVK